MPIVDGLTSTKMIRSFEKSHPTQVLSTRASLNGRVPIIAVSASLVERERQTYIDTGFDGWILKPISFNRLSEIMKGIVESDVRKSNLYRPGVWEHGGWFDEVRKDVFTADTRPSEKPPLNQTGVMAASDGVKVAAASDDPFVREEDSSEQTQVEKRLAGEQGSSAPKASSMPELRRSELRRTGSSEETVTQREIVSSPPPMDEGWG
jgi:CheY-like chemotaxis protein